MKSKLLLVPLALLGLVVTACVPESKNPLSDPRQSSADRRLHGVWLQQMERGEAENYLHIGSEAERPFDVSREEPEPWLMRIWLIGHQGQAKKVSKPVGLRFFTTQLGDATYVNVLFPPEEDLKPGETQRYWFLKYQVDGDTLGVIGMEWNAAASAIENGALSGHVERDERGALKKVELYDSTETIANYLAAGGSEMLFPEKNTVRYRRVR